MAWFSFLLVSEILVFAEPFLYENLAYMKLEGSSRTRLTTLEDGLCSGYKLIHIVKPLPDDREFYGFLNAAEQLELTVPPA